LLYATADNAILGFTVDTITGALSIPTFTPSTSLPCGGAASSSLGLVSPPKLGLLYVSDRQDNQVGGSVYGNIVFNNQVEGFAIGNGTGSLTPLSGSPFALPLVEPYGFPVGMATDPQGKFLYVANVGDIDELAINSTTGALTAISGSPVRGVANGDYLTIDPPGLFLFADGLNGISALAVDANTGALTEVAGSPFPFPATNFAGQSPSALVVDSTGSFLYVVVFEPQEGGAPELSYVAGYSIDATSGALTQVPNTPFFGNTPNSGLSGGIGTAGSFLYVGSGLGIYAFSIASGTGVLTQISGSPFGAGIAPLSLTATSDGKFLYAAFNQIYVFAIDPTTGALSAVGNPVPAASAPFLLNLYNP
jgi:6-phosphogluconolactonase (cycloisomerase 2 family)